VAGSRIRTSQHPWGTLVELCAPDVRNALDAGTVADLTDAFRTDVAGAAVLAAEGAVFCAGGDVKAMAAASAAGSLDGLLADTGAAFADLVAAIVSCPRPVVAALHGDVVGGGISLALACDVRVAARSTRLVPAWGRWGLPPDGGASALLAAAVGPAAASSALMLGDAVTVSSPLAPLLFTEVVEDVELRSAAFAVAARLAARPGAAAAKAVTRSLLLPQLRAQQAVELAALTRAAQAPAVGSALRAVVGAGSP
jgi:2-(1,2-epoxy-1,2-dihydrophenyl)acetyl-CoA isomerase